MSLKFDIFCKVVDNFGDIGFCWRLAKQLSGEHGLTVQLWVDDWKTASKLLPELTDEQGISATIDDVTITKWDQAADFSCAGDVVLETFACGLPEAYVDAMKQQKSLWINIDHLSAEAWVSDFHAKASPQENGLKKYFYFPGFTADTGGLLREKSLLASSFNVSKHFNLSLFAYPHAPIADLFDAIINSNRETVCYVPESVLLPKIADYFGGEAVHVGDELHKENLHVHILPFLTQDDYDALLRSCDINFVRGEDSWVRAIWAGKPFIWQPYMQEDNAHQNKLTAFLEMFYEQPSDVVNAIHHAWNSHTLSTKHWQAYLSKQADITLQTNNSKQNLVAQIDLAMQLIAFCRQQLLSSS